MQHRKPGAAPRNPSDLTQLLDIEKAARELLGGQIKQWNEGRMTVSAHLLLAVRDAVRPPGDMGLDDAWPLREMIKARTEKQTKRGTANDA